MLVYHATSAVFAELFQASGVDGHLLHARAIHGPQDNEPGLFVTPDLSVARRFGLFIFEIEVDESELVVPPTLRGLNVSLQESLANPLEPQALLPVRIEPARLRLVESHPNGYAFNPYVGPGPRP